MTLLLSKRPRKFLSEYGGAVEEIAQGVYVIENPIIHMRVINIEAVELGSADSMFLTAFSKDLARLKETQRSFARESFFTTNKKVLANLRQALQARLAIFEGEVDMGAVADITEYVMPAIRKAEKRAR